MENRQSKAIWAVFLASLMTVYPALGVVAGSVPLGKVVPQGVVELNGVRLEFGSTVYAGDTLATPAEGLALVLLPQGDQLHLGPASQVQLTDAQGGLLARLERGAVLARSGSGQTVAVAARGLEVRPAAAARYEVAVAENAVLVAAQSGAVTVEDARQRYTVPAGQAMRFELAASPQVPALGNAFTDGQTIGLVATVGGGAFLASWLLARKLADDACKDALRSVSPALVSRC